MSILYPVALPIHVSNINNLIHFFSYFSPYFYNPKDICINKHCVIMVFVIVSKNEIIVHRQKRFFFFFYNDLEMNRGWGGGIKTLGKSKTQTGIWLTEFCRTHAYTYPNTHAFLAARNFLSLQ